MQQREQRPNTKSRTPVDYRQQFAQKFNKEVYPEFTRSGWWAPEGYNEGGHFEQTYGNGLRVHGTAGVDSKGNFSAEQSARYAPTKQDPFGDEMRGANFTYYQGKNQNDGKNGFTNGSMSMNPKDVNMHPQFRQMANKGRTRYNQIQQKYNQQRQSQQPQG